MDSEIPPRATPASSSQSPAGVDTPARAARVIDFEVVIEGGDGDEDPHIKQEFRSVDDLIAYHEAVVGEGVRALVSKAMDGRAERSRKTRGSDVARSDEPLPDDAYIDQRSGRVPKDIFLRLHREKRIPTTKYGKRIYARWGDVKKALDAGRGEVRERPAPVEPKPEDDGLDALRKMVGLQPKGGA